MNIELINKITKPQMRLDYPDFNSGDLVSVHVKIKEEGGKERIQQFQGVVLKISGQKANKTFTVRKDSFGVGVERTFFFNSLSVVKVQLLQKGKVRRSRIYYMRERFGKSARIKKDPKFENRVIKKA